MDTLFYAIPDYQCVMSLVWKLYKIMAKRNSSKDNNGNNHPIKGNQQSLSYRRGGDTGVGECEPRSEEGRVPEYHGSLGLRQIDAAQHHGAARRADER